MRVPYSWLKEMTGIDLSPSAIGERMTMSGVEVENIFEEKGDTILELNLTPNRGDCMSMLGVAVEASAVLAHPYKLKLAEAPKGKGKISEHLSVQVIDGEHCPRYTARVISGVKIGTSPEWLVKRLEACGVRSINNVVDATNYVMLEYGQPLHAFDYRFIGGKKIVVKRLEKSHKFVTLDGVERAMTENDLMICDASGPTAVAGIMGGANSDVKPDTTTVVLESAYFEPRGVRKTSSRLGLATESSRRFEKGIDPNRVESALHRLTEVIIQIAGGTPCEDWIDIYPKKIEPLKISLTAAEVNRLIGTTMTTEDVMSCLKRLGMSVTAAKDGNVEVIVPTSRPDVDRPVDLIEEISRIYGYEKIPEVMPSIISSSPLLPEDERVRGEVREALTSIGFNEAINYGFCSNAEVGNFAGLASEDNVVAVANPLSSDWEVMKPTLLPGLVANVQRGINFGQTGLKFFELRSVFRKQKGDWPVAESQRLAGCVFGVCNEQSWSAKETAADFFDIKGAVEVLLARLSISADFKRGAGVDCIHPSISATISINGINAGFLGQIHPELQQKLGFDKPLFCFELDFEVLYKAAIAGKKLFKELPKFQTVRRDLSILVDETVEAGRILSSIRGLKHPLIQNMWIFDFYKGKGIPESKKSLAYAILYGDSEKTLTDDEINTAHNAVLERLKSELGAEIR